MSFQTGLSGLNASAKNLDVIGNNIANANTVGAKSSRAEYAAIVASALGASSGGGAGGAGIGVSVSTISQQFSQGTINITGNNLDVAINGGGFFQLKLADGSAAYTRDGQFKLDKDGNLKTNTGATVMGFPTDLVGTPLSTTAQPLAIPTGAPIPAKQTDFVKARLNLDARAKTAATVPITPRSTYSTSVNVYDAQGIASPVQLYFEKTAAANSWDVYLGLDVAANPAAVPPVAAVTYAAVETITFDASGKITSPAYVGALSPAPAMGFDIPPGQIKSLNPNEASGFLPQTITINLGDLLPDGFSIEGATQYGTSFAVSDLTQDGYTAGTLTGLSITEQGLITTQYSNGESQSRGKIALADFRNVQGLQPGGGNTWIETSSSGAAISGGAGTGNFGRLRSGAVEASNVDLTAELVAMMTAQRDYQANAQTIKTQDTVLQTLVNLR